MSSVLLALPGSEAQGASLAARVGAQLAPLEVRRFPDGEIYVRVDTQVAGRDVMVLSSLHHPDETFLRLALVSATLRELGARSIGLVAPYLSFMRQDQRFHPGEGVTSVYFARLLSASVDWMVTVDPHLHRWKHLDEIFQIPTYRVAAAPAIAAWIRTHVPRPLLIGPDEESEQWVAPVASLVDAPFVILDKVRHGDRDVSVSEASLDAYRGRTPVVVDDIISTGRTMIEATLQVLRAGAPRPVCIGIHAVFADQVHEDMVTAGAAQVVTTNTISHATNQISVDDLLAAAITSRAP
jgi:ribose-phosphate pyrophosphokinase